MSSFNDGPATPIPASKLVQDLGVQEDNLFSPSGAVITSRRSIFMIRHSFQDLPKSADVSHLKQIQGLATGLVTGFRHLHSLQRRRVRADLITAFEIFPGTKRTIKAPQPYLNDVRHSFLDLSKSDLISLYGAQVLPHLEYCMNNAGNWHSSPSLLKETAAAAPQVSNY